MDNLDTRALWPVMIFAALLILAVVVGNALLVFVLQRPLEQIPNILKFIVHGISLGFIAALAKKYFVK